MQTAAKVFALFLSILCPAAGHVLITRHYTSLIYPLTTFSLIVIFALSRAIESILATSIFIASIVALFLAGMFKTLMVSSKNFFWYRYFKHFGAVTVFSLLFVAALNFIALNKSKTLGFEIFIVRSNSMRPALVPGDIVIAGTWNLQDRDFNKSDIVFFESVAFPRKILIKRVKSTIGKIGKDKEQTLEVEGDSSENSIDSRHFGPISVDDVVGKALWVISDKGFIQL